MVRIDKVQLDIAINGDPARLKLHQLEQDASAVKKEMKGIKDETERANKQAKLDNIRKEMEDLKHQIGLTNMTTGELSKRLTDLKRIQAKLDPNSKLWKEYDDEIKAVIQRQKELNGVTEKTSSTFEGIRMKTLAVIGAITALVTGVAGFIGSIIQTRSEFEKYEAILTSSLGSQEAASDAMDMISQTAAKTNFSLMQLTDVYVKLANRNLRPNQEDLMRLADMANATGKDMGQLSEAIMDINNQERWKEFGVKVKTEGDKVSLTFKGMTQTVEKTEAAVMKAITTFGAMPGVMGQTEAISATLEGRISNLGDSWDRMLNAMGTGGFSTIAKGVIASIGGIIDSITEWVSISPVEKLQEEQAELNSLVSSITSLNEGNETRNRLINELQLKYPDFIGNLKLEELTNENLRKKIAEVNAEYERKINLEQGKSDVKNIDDQILENQKEQDKLIRRINDQYKELFGNYGMEYSLQEKKSKLQEKYKQGLLTTNEKLLIENTVGAYVLLNNVRNKGRDLDIEKKRALIEQTKAETELLKTGKYKIDQSGELIKIEKSVTVKLTEDQLARIALYQKYVDSKREIDKALSAEEDKALKKAMDKEKKMLEKQQKEQEEIANKGVSELDKEYGRYRQQLQKMGLMDKNYLMVKKKLTSEEQEAAKVALEVHFKNIDDINEKQAKKDLKDKKDAVKQIENILTEKHNAELEKLETAENNKLIAESKTQSDRDRIHNEFNEEREARELAFLLTLKKLYEDAGLDTVNIDKRISKERLKQYEQGNKDLERLLKNKEDLLSNYNNGDEDAVDSEESNELTKLQQLWEAKLLTEEEYLEIQDNIHEEYTKKRFERDSNYLQQGIELQQQMSNAVTGLKDLELAKLQSAYQKDSKDLDSKYKEDIAKLNQKLKTGQLSEEQFTRQKEALDKKYSDNKTNLEESQAEKEKAIKKRFANAEFSLKVAEIVGNTAVAIMKGFAQLGPVGGALSAALLAATGAIQIGIANEQRAQVMQLARGKYEVIGAEDGKTYNASFKQNLSSGLVSRPTLVAEEPELVMSIEDTRFAMRNYPHLLNDIRLIRAGVVPQRAEGKYDAVEKSQSVSSDNGLLLGMIIQNTQAIQLLHSEISKGIRAYHLWGPVDIKNFEKAQTTIKDIESDANRYE